VLCDVGGEIAQRREDAPVIRVVGAQRKAVALRDHQRQFQQIDRIQSQPLVAEQRRCRIDALRRQLQVGDFGDGAREFRLERRLRRGSVGASIHGSDLA